MIRRPMLAGSIVDPKNDEITAKNWQKVEDRLPLMISPKLDGIRCVQHHEHGTVSRTLKQIQNRYINEVLRTRVPLGLDGEIMILDDEGRPVEFNDVQSAVMTREGTPTFEYWVFDHFRSLDTPFSDRYNELGQIVNRLPEFVKLVPHFLIHTIDEIQAVNTTFLNDGFEGSMLRLPSGPYKQGRSTVNQAWLLKVKEFEDAEGTIIGYKELHRNQNPGELDALGYTKRSSHKANQVPADTLGALLLMTKWGELSVGSGFDMALRDQIWQNRKHYIGHIITFRFQKIGMRDVPRIPTFKGFRHD